MGSKIRNGKAYEHSVFGFLTLEGFDVYPTLADDQGIDGVLRFKQAGNDLPKYFDLQIKGGRIWANIRCKTKSLSKNSILILFNASTSELICLTQKDALDLFPPIGSEFGDVYITKAVLQKLKNLGLHRLETLKSKIGFVAG